ncbi:MAG: trypsin-like peptidase domain-containing protein [Planctomycetes bacterium]|nr:trypsin-like peptidase domain-containing protein [Planctomycetota bacterium]
MKTKLRFKRKLAKYKWLALAAFAAFIFIETQVWLIYRNTQNNRQGIHENTKSVAELREDADNANNAIAAVNGRIDESETASRTNIQNLRGQLNSASSDTWERLAAIEKENKSNLLFTMEGMAKLDKMAHDTALNTDELNNAMLYPSVQISVGTGIGAGIIVYSKPETGGNNFHTYALTAHHVISRAIKRIGAIEIRDKVSVTAFFPDGSSTIFQADIVSYNESKDMAILKICSTDKFNNTAVFMPRAELKNIKPFTGLYAIGCPLGNCPMPSSGELMSKSKFINGENFWMMNAPTIYGNSGGGIFIADTGKLIGISSMICVYDNFISIPVAHLGIMVPPDMIYDWLDSQYYRFLYDNAISKETCETERKEARKTTPEIVRVTWEY